MGKNKQLFGPIILNNKLITKVQNYITNMCATGSLKQFKRLVYIGKIDYYLFSRLLYIKISNSGGNILGKK